MKAQPTIYQLVAERLNQLGADTIPLEAREIIYTDIHARIAKVIKRNVSITTIARAVAVSFAFKEGSKGRSPLASSSESPTASSCVAGSTPDNFNIPGGVV